MKMGKNRSTQKSDIRIILTRLERKEVMADNGGEPLMDRTVSS